MNNLEENPVVGNGNRLKHEKTIRKREVLLSRISVYIVIIIVSCHTIRIVPNVWEIVQACSGVNEEVNMNYRIRFVCLLT